MLTVVLMDVQMPVMDGIRATRRIREVERASGWPRTPILALTAGAVEVIDEMIAAEHPFSHSRRGRERSSTR